MKYICIEGCVGIGKTTIATQLANAIKGSHLLLEDYGSHPFLKDFYNDDRFTFETELNFLLIHYHQLYKVMDTQYSILIGDYFFDKDELFADANVMNEKELDIFMKLYDYLRGHLIRPDIIICLYGSTDMIYHRIKNRRREVEENISYNYVKKISDRYNCFFSEWKKKYNTIEINMNENDFMKDSNLINQLLTEINTVMKRDNT